jgi:hypothetical protein
MFRGPIRLAVGQTATAHQTAAGPEQTLIEGFSLALLVSAGLLMVGAALNAGLMRGR